jgi:hypothetical protein
MKSDRFDTKTAVFSTKNTPKTANSGRKPPQKRRKTQVKTATDAVSSLPSANETAAKSAKKAKIARNFIGDEERKRKEKRVEKK